MESVGRAIASIWTIPGVSEFAAALLGGSMTMLAQWLALRHDQKKAEASRADERKAYAWATFFKIRHIYEALTQLKREVIKAQAKVHNQGLELWQAFQVAPHDFEPVSWETRELVLLIDHREFEVMQRYLEATAWLSNMIQSCRAYREMRIELLTSTVSDVRGTQGALIVDKDNRQQVMPRIAHLRSLSESLAEVILSQQPDSRQLLLDYADAMQKMIGMKPDLELAE